MTATRRTGVARRDGARPSSIAPSLARFARSPESGREKRWEKGERGLTCPPPPPSYGSSILIASAWVQCWHTGESRPIYAMKPGSAGITKPQTLSNRDRGKKQICHARAAISHNRSVGGKGKNRGCMDGGRRLAASPKGVAAAPFALRPYSIPISAVMGNISGVSMCRVREMTSRDAP